jgi:hypothetical protein
MRYMYEQVAETIKQAGERGISGPELAEQYFAHCRDPKAAARRAIMRARKHRHLIDWSEQRGVYTVPPGASDARRYDQFRGGAICNEIKLLAGRLDVEIDRFGRTGFFDLAIHQLKRAVEDINIGLARGPIMVADEVKEVIAS